jgi:hypothetical protein
MSRGGLSERPRRNPQPYQPWEVDPELCRGHLRIVVLYEHDGYYQMLIDGRRAAFVSFEGRLHWDDWCGPLVDDLPTLLSLRNQMGVAAFCFKQNFSAIWSGAEVVK